MKGILLAALVGGLLAETPSVRLQAQEGPRFRFDRMQACSRR